MKGFGHREHEARGAAGRQVCPACGSYNVHPTCVDASCGARWCSRAECGWENDVACVGHLTSRPLHAWELETPSEGVTKRQLKRSQNIGTIAQNYTGKLAPTGFTWDHRDAALPGWSDEELVEFISGVVEFIEALPTSVIDCGTTPDLEPPKRWFR